MNAGETYRGIPVPGTLTAARGRWTESNWWKRGVDAALAAADDRTAPPATAREVADFILRAVTGLLYGGVWPKAYDVGGRHGGTDEQPWDTAVIRSAADTVGREHIRNIELRSLLAGMEPDTDGSTT